MPSTKKASTKKASAKKTSTNLPQTDDRLPFDFVILGRPVSKKSKQEKAAFKEWIQLVRQTVQEKWEGSPVDTLLSVRMTYFYDELDERESSTHYQTFVAKPILDAFNGIIYQDDYQICEFDNRLRDLNGSFRLRGMTPELAAGFMSNQAFMHVAIQVSPSWEDL